MARLTPDFSASASSERLREERSRRSDAPITGACSSPGCAGGGAGLRVERRRVPGLLGMPNGCPAITEAMSTWRAVRCFRGFPKEAVEVRPAEQGLREVEQRPGRAAREQVRGCRVLRAQHLVGDGEPEDLPLQVVEAKVDAQVEAAGAV